MVKIAREKNRKSSIIILFCILFIGSVIFYFYILRPEQQYYYAHYVKIHGVYLLKPIEIKDFLLRDTQGKGFTKENLKGHWTMMYFGFTHCDMVCPATMGKLNKMYMILQKTIAKKDLPQVVFISIDPERDSLKKIYDYVSAFNSHFIGIKGSMESTIAIERDLHIVTSEQTNAQDNNYTLNHSAEILLVNPSAEIQAYFSYPQQPDYMAKDYQSILNRSIKEQK